MKLFNIFRKEKTKFSKRTVLYLSSEFNRILIVPKSIDQFEILHEQEEIEMLELNCSNKILGKAIKRNLDKFIFQKSNNKKRNQTDWPAFKASKLKTITEFKKEYLRISIFGANESNLLIFFEADMNSKHLINIKSSISANAENDEIGFLTKKLHDIQLNRKIE